MAVSSNTLIGGTRGRVGNVIFSKWKGKNILKEKPSSVAQPNTPGQISQKSAFAQAVAIARLIMSAIRVSFREVADGITEYNAFMKYNLDEAWTRSGSTATYVPANLKVAKGTLGALLDFTSDGLTGRVLDVTWTDNTGSSNANSSDRFQAVLTSADGLNVVSIPTIKTRVNAGESLTIPGSWSLTGARCAGYFTKADGSMSSDSVNIAVA